MRTSEGRWSLGLVVENLTDADVLEAAVDSFLFPGGFVALQEFGRRLTVDVRAAW